ncbi:hypothetical protein ACT2CV_00290 [Pasteurellaceae bacterium 22721_9_1]
MKKFAELEFIQNLSWKQVLTYSAISITTLIGATWTLATRTSDSKADYVNMRYAEISALETQVKALQLENSQLKSKLGIKESANSKESKFVENEIKELKKREPVIDDFLGVIYLLEYPYNNYGYFTFTFENGESVSKNIDIGKSYKFSAKNNKTYQFIVISTDTEKDIVKYMIKEIPENK